MEESVTSPRRLLFSIMLLILAATFCSAGDIYIAQNATGGNTGGDCADAHSASWFNSSSNWGSGATQISAGTTVHVCGVITGSAGTSGILVFQGSGTNGAPITLKFEAGASLAAPYCGSLGNEQGCLVVSTASKPRSYITVDGGTPCGWTLTTGSEGSCNGSITNTANGTNLGNQADSNAVEMTACSNCEIRNLGIYNIYVQSGGATNADPQYQNCIVFSGSNLLIHDNQMHDVGWCLFYQNANGDNNISVYQNDIFNTPHPMFWSGGTGTASNGFIYSNHFHDYANWNTSNGTYHVEGIHTSGTGPVFNNLYIYNNYFGPNEGANLFSQVYLSPNTGSPGSPAFVNQSYVFNNVCHFTQTGPICITVGGGNGNAVYNNTMIADSVDNNNPTGLNWSNISQNGSYTFTFKNNASQGFYSMVNNDMNGAEGPGITADYNVYAACTDPYGGCLNAFVQGGTSTWPTYQTNSFLQEKNSVPAALTPPNKCCAGTLGLNSSTYVPQSGSVVIGAATNLSSLCTGNLVTLCSDAAGNPRPTSGNWDAGAYESGSSAQLPAPPTGLTASVQ
jgi:hypothetical protein